MRTVLSDSLLSIQRGYKYKPFLIRSSCKNTRRCRQRFDERLFDLYSQPILSYASYSYSHVATGMVIILCTNEKYSLRTHFHNTFIAFLFCHYISLYSFQYRQLRARIRTLQCTPAQCVSSRVSGIVLSPPPHVSMLDISRFYHKLYSLYGYVQQVFHKLYKRKIHC